MLWRGQRNRRLPQPASLPAWKTLEWWFKLAQVLAICGAGVWTLTLFLDFQRDQERLRTQQMQLSNEQLRLTNAHLESTSATELESKRVALQQQSLLFEQSSQTSQFEIQRSKYAGRIAELEADLKAKERRDAFQGRVRVMATLTLRCQPEPGVYRATFHHEIENMSKTDVQVSWEIIHRHIGTLRVSGPQQAASAVASIVEINSPPVGIYGLMSEGAVEWQEVGHRAYVFPGSDMIKAFERAGYRAQTGGGSIKTLMAGGKSHSSATFVVTGGPEQWVGVALAFGIDRGVTQDTTFRETRAARLGDCETIAEPAERPRAK